MNDLRKPSRWGILGGWFLFVLGLPGHAGAFNQPPVNLSLTTFWDGGAPPGFYYLSYAHFVEGRKALDRDGNTIPGDGRVNVFVQLNQFYCLSGGKFLGGNLALDVVLPVVSPTVRGAVGPFPLTANTAGLGDLAVGPAVQWDKGTLAGRPFFQRVEVDVVFPTGKYDKGTTVNPGSNLLTVEAYYSFVWLFHPKWESSWRFFYAVHGENDDTKIQPGRLLHANYAFSYQVHPTWRAGAAGYILRQVTNDEVNGIDAPGSKERAYALGPGVMYWGEGLMITLSHPVEFGVRNRFKGSRTTLQIIHRF